MIKKPIFFLLACLYCLPLFAQQSTVDSFTDGKYVKVNNAKLWVVTVGQGDPVFLLPVVPAVHILD